MDFFFEKPMLQVDSSFEVTDNVKAAGLPQQDAANPVGIPGLVTGWNLDVQQVGLKTYQ